MYLHTRCVDIGRVAIIWQPHVLDMKIVESLRLLSMTEENSTLIYLIDRAIKLMSLFSELLKTLSSNMRIPTVV